MFYYKELQFQSNAVLHSEDLRESNNYPRELAEIFYKDYPDGIIEGTEVGTRNGRLVIRPGVVKYKGLLYHSASDIVVDFQANGKQQYLRLRFWDKNVFPGVNQYETEMIVTDQKDQFPYELELARFVAENGADLLKKQESFSDLFVTFNNLDFRSVPYSSRSGLTLAPIITKTFAKEVLARNTENYSDIAFAMTCLQGNVIERDLIISYLSARTGRNLTSETTQLELSNMLKQIVEGAGGRETARGKAQQERRIIID